MTLNKRLGKNSLIYKNIDQKKYKSDNKNLEE